jgi:glycosyltransferase involved in cell wall biosynthesis
VKVQALVDSRLVVVPSRSEVFAITAVEALMCSRPVLLSSACGLYPMPDERHGVRLFDPHSIESFARNLQSAVMDEQFFAAAQNGRNFVRNEFSIQAVTGKLEGVYQALGGGNG